MPLDQVDVDDYYYDDMSKKLIQNGKQPDEEKEMGFLDHLEELRWHIIRAVIAIFTVGIALFIMKDFVFDVIFGPKNEDFLSYRFICNLSEWAGLGDRMCFKPVDFELQITELGEAFLTHIKVSFIGGFIVAFPYVFWEMWRFVSPGLYEKERKAARGIILICSLLFFTGVLFGYFVVSPFAVNFLAGYEIEGVLAEPKLQSMVNYMIMFTAPAGLIFELPIVVYFLSKVGLLTPEVMKAYRRHAIIIILMVSAIITPPDVVTQFLIGIPLFILYEISITISKRVVKNLEKEENEEK